MATKRQRNNSWEFVVRRKGLLPRPLYLTFDTEEEGDKYCKRLDVDPRETRPYLCDFLEALQPRLRTQLGPKCKSGVRP